jgi:ATP-dependent Clp protease, protease subunit
MLAKLCPHAARAIVGLQHLASTSVARNFNVVPMVIENMPGGERHMDIWSMLLKKRIVFLQGEITAASATSLIAQILYLESVHKHDSIQMYINSPGGSVVAGLAIFDTMNYVSTPVETLVAGQASSMASLLLCAGERGKRRALPNSKIMMHQPLGGTSGQASDILIQAHQMERTKQQLVEIYAERTGQMKEVILERMDRDFWLTAAEAVQFGVIDTVVEHREAVPS